MSLVARYALPSILSIKDLLLDDPRLIKSTQLDKNTTWNWDSLTTDSPKIWNFTSNYERIDGKTVK
jgi:hypothetical protein